MTSKRQDIILNYLKQQGPSSRENLEQHLLLLGKAFQRSLSCAISASWFPPPSSKNPARVELQNML